MIKKINSNIDTKPIDYLTIDEFERTINNRKLHGFEKLTIALTSLLCLVSILLNGLEYNYTQNILHGEQVNGIGIIMNIFCLLCSLVIMFFGKKELGIFLFVFNIVLIMTLFSYAHLGE
jgi:hypothetical protein